MCGIAGIYRFDRQADQGDLDRVRKMTDAVRHRGPDAWGVSRLGQAVLGHRRLSIIDLSAAANQPLCDPEGRVWITFNGEIYNFQELRQDLLEEGIRFRTNSDTEVMVVGYREWGIARLLERMRGMFAFALLDCSQPRPRMILARDRLGIKPLYYYWTADFVLFASEVRSLRASGLTAGEVDRAAFLSFLQWGSVSGPRTVLAGARALPAGHFVSTDQPEPTPQAYWRLSDFQIDPPEPGPAAADCYREVGRLLEEAVRLHQVSDVPVGVFLSGGIDSSSLAVLAAAGREDPIHTISVAFDEDRFNEEQIAEQVALRCGAQHSRVRVSGHDFVSQMEDVFQAFDQPTIDGVNTFYVSWAARRCGLKVVMSGLGSDELFLGYPLFHKAHQGELLCRLLRILPEAARRLALEALSSGLRMAGSKGADRMRSLIQPGAASYYRLYRGLFHDSDVMRLAGAGRQELEQLGAGASRDPAREFLGDVIRQEFNGYLSNQLLRDADAMSMAHGLEVRVPFLDHVLVEKVLQMPGSIKLKGKSNKPLLVKAMGDRLPRQVWDRPKQGFVFPLPIWLRQHRRRLEAESLSGDWLDPRTVRQVWKDFSQGRIHWSRPWAVLVWSQWQARQS